MSAAPQAIPARTVPENPVPGDEVWAVYKTGGALHLYVYDLHGLGHGGWSTPCGCGAIYRGTPPIDTPAAPNYWCGRCLRHQEREQARCAALQNPCAGCDDVDCMTCVAPNEARMLAWLHRHHTRNQPAGRYHFLTQVRSGPESQARTADAVAIDSSTTTGFEISGFEVKVSRANWQQELLDPRKWVPVGGYCDRWWLAVSDLDIVRGGELPAQWGLMLVTPTICHVVRPAPKLEPKSIDRAFVVGLLRAATRLGEAR